VAFQQIMDSPVGGDPGQAIEHFKAGVAKRTVGAKGRPTKSRLVD
jgi:hypothetical protein